MLKATLLRLFCLGLLFAPGPGRAASDPTPTPAPAAPPALPSDVSALLTPGADRFVIAGISIGAGPQAVQQFLDAKGLHPSGLPVMGSIPGGQGKKAIAYTSTCSYTNDKSDAGKIEVVLRFTPPFPSADGVVSRVSEINYTTYFGAAVKDDEIKNGLIERFGKTNGEGRGSQSWTLEWPISIVSNKPNVIPTPLVARLSAQVFPPSAASDFGRLFLQLTDLTFSAKSLKFATHYAATGETSYPDYSQDMTKPSY